MNNLEEQNANNYTVKSLNKNHKITVIDSMMGSGKSKFIMDFMVHNPANYLVVLPLKEEIDRYETELSDLLKRTELKIDNDINIFCADYRKDKNGHYTKTQGLKNLLVSTNDNYNIILCTHQLIRRIDNETMEIIMFQEYHLVIDECLNCVKKFTLNNSRQNDLISKSDFAQLLESNYIFVDEKGFIVWNDDKWQTILKNEEYRGKHNQFKTLCDLHSLRRMKTRTGWSDSILIWNFPLEFFDLFVDTKILTYMWEGNYQSAYFDLFKVQYSHLTLDKKTKKLIPFDFDTELSERKRLFNLMNIYNGRLNNIGTPVKTKTKLSNPLSKSWYVKKSKDKTLMKILKNNTTNYFVHICKSKSAENMFTTFKDFKKFVANKGYSKGFVACNAKATNSYRNKECLAYLINCYPDVTITDFFKSYGVEIDSDTYAISELLQWIFRSQIRNGKSINLYIPSKRMRDLLIKWGSAEYSNID